MPAVHLVVLGYSVYFWYFPDWESCTVR